MGKKENKKSADDHARGPSRAEIDDITDRLIEKTEKLNYFIATASSAILVFTFNDFNAATGLLRSAPTVLVAVGWGSLVVAALSSLVTVRQGHLLYRLYLAILNKGRETLNKKEEGQKNRLYAVMRFGEFTMIAAFIVGISCLAASYVVAL